MTCPECGEREITCADNCAECEVEFLRANPEEYDPEERTPDGRRVYALPGYRDVKAMMEAFQ